MAFTPKTFSLVNSNPIQEAPNLYVYNTNDDNAAIVTADYFLPDADRLKVNDIILANVDLDGTPNTILYRVSAHTGASITVSAAT